MRLSSFRSSGSKAPASALPVSPTAPTLQLSPVEPLFPGLVLADSTPGSATAGSSSRQGGQGGDSSSSTMVAPEASSPSTSRSAMSSGPTTQPIAIPTRASASNAPIPSYEDATSPRTPNPGPLSAQRRGSILSLSAEGNQYLRDSFGSPRSRLQDIMAEDEGPDDDDDDDPLVPRSPRSPPQPNLVPLSNRRIFVPTSAPPTPPDSDSNHTELDGIDVRVPLDLPPPPELPPGYSAHLAEDELRLISTVHLEENHPAAAFFSQMTSTALSPIQPVGVLPPPDAEEQQTGGKKLKLTITSGGERVNPNGTGPLFIRMGRGGKVEGRIDVGKVDHVTNLEVAILSYVNTSYYVRGQYTLIDTLPLARRQITLYPPANTFDGFSAGPGPSSPSAGPSVPTEGAGASATSAAPSAASASTPADTGVHAHGGTLDGGAPRTVVIGKDVFLSPEQSFTFSIDMPTHHYRDPNVELPPSAQIFQVGLQAGVEHVLRIKMARKSWRMSEHIGCPIIYEPRSYVAPRRLRVLTTNDALCPGWRTIRLNGGKAIKPTDGTEAPINLPGVEVSLLLPSPPILYIPDGGAPPPIPFHLHFHSQSALPLATFSDPKECTFVIRFMRVASMRIGSEKEIRRMEILSKVELWQEGGPRMTLGEEQEVQRASTSGTSTRRPGSGSASGTGERRKSFAERRPSFLKRRSSVVSPGTSPVPESPLARQASNLPTEPPIAEDPPAPAETPSILAPLELGSTDVHILGQMTLQLPSQGPQLLRNLVQSFMSPEIGISYVLEVGLQPKHGAVKEKFTHVWGGGLVEVVLGHRERR